MSKVVTGLDVLLQDEALCDKLKHARVGLLVNPTSVTRTFEHAIDALQKKGVNIVRLFGPEHGVRAEAQDMEAVTESIDPISKLPTISLYGHSYDSLEPDPEQVRDLDVVIADIQDIGTRYYTYAYTIGLMMKVCGQVDTACWVLDRPNPLGGEVIEGNRVDPECKSFVGMQPLAMRHGMTLGELARYFMRYGGWECQLKVIEMKGWERSMWYDQTGVPWVMPSPNMPTLQTAITYPGQCILEGTNLSEGRGTTRPFELFGAPYLDAQKFKEELDRYNLEGVSFRACSFKPMFQKHAEKVCRGVQLHVTDREVFRSVKTTFCILAAAQKLAPEQFGWREQAYEFVEDVPAIDLLCGQLWVREKLEGGMHPVELVDEMASHRTEFEQKRQECLIY